MKRAIQERAQETEDHLLDAAEMLLRRGGLEACTVPAIAEAAGRSVGAVYRRFPDKDILLRTVFRRYFARAAEQNAKALARMEKTPVGLANLVGTIVHGMIAGQRRERKLIAALLSFARSHGDPAFRREACEMSGASLTRFREMLLARRGEMRHDDPEQAVDIALSTLSLSVQGVMQRDEMNPLPDIDDATLARELAAMVMAYLD